MEYEIQDEDVLFDDSTNPSLERHAPVPDAARPEDPADKRKLQKAELIPEEEEHQLA